MKVRKGQILHYPKLDRFAEALEDSSFHIPGPFNKVGTVTGRFNSRYPAFPNLPMPNSKNIKVVGGDSTATNVLGLSRYSAIMDEANFAKSTPNIDRSTWVKVRWLDGQWRDATWRLSNFVVKHPLELLASCAD